MHGAQMIDERVFRPRRFSAYAALACSLAAFCLVIFAGLSPASAADMLRIAAQKTGTFGWVLEVIKDHGLAEKAGLDLEVTELASTDAGKIAMMGGSADIVVSDWLWVSRERTLGSDLTFYPYSSSLGAVMVPQQSPIKTLADLKGKKIGVAGGQLDKSWLLLQAVAKNSSLDLETDSTVVYGAPSLLFQKALQGESDANLNFWNFCAELEARGFKRLVSMEDIEKDLGAAERVSMVGYVFDEAFAARHRDALRRFFAVTRQAKDVLATSDEAWQKLAPRVGITDPAELAGYRKAYVEGIPHRPVAAEIEDARKLYRILAEVGGMQLVGPSNELAPGTYSTDTGVD